MSSAEIERLAWFAWRWVASRLAVYLLAAAVFVLAVVLVAGAEALRRWLGNDTPLTGTGGLLACVAGPSDAWAWHLATLVALALGIEGIITRSTRRKDASMQTANDRQHPGER